MEFIIVTGLSGSGKTQAMNCLEDLGYYCIDNLPPQLMNNFIQLTAESDGQMGKAAFGIDVRGGEFFDELKDSLNEFKIENINFKVLFLEASDEVLIRRYKETRRAHPLSPEGTGIKEGIMAERKKLAEIRNMADFIIDTSTMKVARFHEELHKILSVEGEAGFSMTILSFGFKNGIPLEADLVFDLRFIPNPFYVPSLRKLTGNNKKVQEYVMSQAIAREFEEKTFELLELLIPSYIKEGKTRLVIAFGCTGGRHRSVTMANIFADKFKGSGRRILTSHRDL